MQTIAAQNVLQYLNANPKATALVKPKLANTAAQVELNGGEYEYKLFELTEACYDLLVSTQTERLFFENGDYPEVYKQLQAEGKPINAVQ